MSAFDRWCRYCRISWSVEFDPETDEVLRETDTTCPECESADALTLDEARRAVRR